MEEVWNNYDSSSSWSPGQMEQSGEKGPGNRDYQELNGHSRMGDASRGTASLQHSTDLDLKEEWPDRSLSSGRDN